MKILALSTSEITHSQAVKSSLSKAIPESDLIDHRFISLELSKAPTDLEKLLLKLHKMGIDPDSIPSNYDGVAIDDKASWVLEFRELFSGKIPVYRFGIGESKDKLNVERIDSPNEKHLLKNGVTLN